MPLVAAPRQIRAQGARSIVRLAACLSLLAFTLLLRVAPAGAVMSSTTTTTAAAGVNASNTETSTSTSTSSSSSTSTSVTPTTAATAPSAAAIPAGEPSAQSLRLSVEPRHPRVGQVITIRVVQLPADTTNAQWQLSGGGRLQPESTGEAELRAGQPGTLSVSFTANAGTVSLRASTLVRVDAVASQELRAGVRSAARSASRHRFSSAGGDPAVAVVDYAFNPGSVTIHAGDTITWTNSGKQPHTATANNNSFDTGILKHGQSASHTFQQAGTYTYFCVVHPYMKGTIVVLAAASSRPAAGSSSSSAAGTSATAPASSATTSTPASTTGASSAAATGPTLPMTGLPVLPVALIGLLLAGVGGGLRRVARAHGQ